VVAIIAISTAFAVFSFYDPIQSAVIERTKEAVGAPVDWQFNFQYPFSGTGRDIYRLHNFLLGISIAIVGLIAVLVAIAVWLFRSHRNPVPARTTHNTPLEMLWTVVPVIVLLVIGTWSFSLLYKVDTIPQSDVSLKVTGNQWYWSYEYPDNGGVQFSSNIVPDDKLPPEQRSLRLMTVDQYVVLPVNSVIRILVTASDVVHSWGVQSLGVKKDAIPGRINETWTRIEREGTYYGDCYELCGRNPAFRRIGTRAVSQERSRAWIEDARRKRARGQPPAPRAPTDLADLKQQP